MKNILYCLIGLLLITFSGCASFNPSFGITTFGQTATGSRDTLEGKITTETFVVVPLGMSFASDDDMGLKIGRLKRNNEIIGYYFRAEVHSTGWLFAEDIGLKIDEQTYHLHDNSPSRQARSG
jgi:hypothetical protein